MGRALSRSYQRALDYADSAIAESDVESIRAAGILLEPFDYYVFGSVYPPLKAMSPLAPDELHRGASKDLNLYVHIPFCDQYCSFCHFAKEIGSSGARVDDYLDALEAEIAVVRPRLDPEAVVKTMYAGGGTASYLTSRQMRRLFDVIRSALEFDREAEISYELHPGLVHKPDADERLETLVDLGVNRWVFGTQSMDDTVLDQLHRGHSARDTLELLQLLEPIAEGNVSVDLIFGLPYQTTETWYRSLETLVDVGVPKFNIFPLMFKIGDPITRQYMREPENFADLYGRLQMHYVTEYLLVEQNHYHSGPVFYYSKSSGPPSYQQVSKFETIDDVNLLGIGVSAFGYIGGTHYYNECDIDRYIEICLERRAPTWVGISLSDEERLRRSVIQGLRSSGISGRRLYATTGIDPLVTLQTEFATLERLGLATMSDDQVTLTRHGCAHADGIGLMFVSDDIRELVNRRNAAIVDTGRPTKDPFERYDFTPLERRNESYVKVMPAVRGRSAS